MFPAPDAKASNAMTPPRLETFSDRVFMAAAALLVLGVGTTGNPLGRSLPRMWPSYVAYTVSFMTIGIIWLNHHILFSQIGKVNRSFLLINITFLMAVTFIPFPTHLISTSIRGEGAEPAALLYGTTLTAAATLLTALWLRISRTEIASLRLGHPRGERHLANSSPEPVRVSGCDGDCPRQSGGQFHAPRRDRSRLHHWQFHFQPHDRE